MYKEKVVKKNPFAEWLLLPFKVLKKACFVIGAVVLFVTFVIGIYIFNFFHTMPDIESKVFTDLKKDAVARVHKRIKSEEQRKKYFWTSIDKMDRELIYAIIMSEDSTFLEHNGVNFNAMIDSLARNIRQREYSSGASTITQQVVKNLYLTNEKSIIRKLKEIFIARELESRFTKNQILEVYLNIAELGPDIYGVGMASYHFFKIPPKDMTADKGAYLALMLPSPRKHYFSIFTNKYLSPENERKIFRILRDMHEEEYLAPKQYADRKRLKFLTEFKKR